MSDVISFRCPECQGETFKTTTKVKRLEDFDGAVCTGCGRKVTEDDVKRKAVEIARKLMKGVFKGK
jgi:transcription elongation factor Elf1